MTTQGKYWFFTDNNVDTTKVCYDTEPDAFWTSKDIVWSKGQLERGEGTERLHWQFVVCFNRKVRFSTVKTRMGDWLHIELSRSAAANEYVWEDETSEGHRWEWGQLPFRRNSRPQWDAIRDAAIAGDLRNPVIPANVFVNSYSNLRRIQMDHMTAQPMERNVNVFVGDTGMGKSRRAWYEAGFEAYPKTPTTKFWDGYQGQGNVVIDEFTGQIEITHMLRWLDRYPVLVETKGSGTVLKAQTFWITSNLPPSMWYPNAPEVQMLALMRRLEVTYFDTPWTPPQVPEES